MAKKSTTPKQKALAIASCDNMHVNLINAGKFIELQDAVNSLQAYFKAPGTPPRTEPTHIYGHTFGLNNLRTLLYHIDQYNGNVDPDDPQIKGIRIYYGIDERNDHDFPLRPPKGKFRDLIFMPVLEDGNDLYPVDPKLESTGMILSGSRPCPNQCSFTFLDKV